jgi:phage N-6-adenine-methyltransferase
MRKCTVCRKPFPPAQTGRPRRYCSDACRMAAWRKRNKRLKGSREVMGSSRSDDWPTDPKVFQQLDARYGPFTLDVCASPENAKCERFFTSDDDGLAQDWTGRVWMNPPYGRTLGEWMAKAWGAAATTAEIVVCLVPARTDTRWFHDYALRGEVVHLRGRLKFGATLVNPAPFPSLVVIFRNANVVTKQEAA